MEWCKDEASVNFRGRVGCGSWLNGLFPFKAEHCMSELQ